MLKTFQTVARNRNISRSAEELHLSQSAVSDQVQSLEADLAAKLFVRSRSGLELTPAGQALIAYSEEILSLSEEARAAIASISGSKGETLNIGALQSIACTRLPGWLTTFGQANPAIAIRLVVRDSGDLMRQLKTGAIDAAFCFDRGVLGDSFAKRLIAAEPLVLITPANGQLASLSSTVAELASASFLATEAGCVYRSLFDQAFADAGMPSPKLAAEVGSIEAIARMVETGAGIGLVPRLAVADALQRGLIREMPWPGTKQAASLVMIWRRRRVQPPALKLLLAAASEGLDNLRSSGAHPRRAIPFPS
ncbi:LysR family transcriptional regulator [Rhizobium herbae]|uniref:DNA-binding transcriptional LysR family regulator n=1 Tax=Rhizobium herbae TaxID=508661 RepID=A0ABS4EIC0_9HYPH|nr:LysR family transcriptional regulator [Rhizobium herbae]MBP1857690.1 DNA-binding transcriptional LysR family regulator [Rhizobium herbae]